MQTAIFHHPCFLDHDTGPGHPERSDRMRAIHRVLEQEDFTLLERIEAPRGTEEQILAVHPERHFQRLRSAIPEQGHVAITADTIVSPASMEAAFHAVGASCAAVDDVVSGRLRNAFCVMRPPGHHAEGERAMGFCLFNNAVIAATHAVECYGVDRVAVVDFDVHHGNGTQALFWKNKSMMYASTHQAGIFPGTGAQNQRGDYDNIVNVPLASGSAGDDARAAFDARILPSIRKFQPDLIVVSAGFDAHRLDPLGGLAWTEGDFADLTRRLADLAEDICDGRLVSLLEGGYHLDALAHSVAHHLRVLMEG